jgi:hypothetical protein
MGFTTEAVAKNARLLPCDHNRAWAVWDEPPASLPQTVVAFRLVFPTSELAVRPEQRGKKAWKNVVFIEAAPPGKMTVVTLFVTLGDVLLRADSEPSFVLASLTIGENRYAKLVAHGEPIGDLAQRLDEWVAQAKTLGRSLGVETAPEHYGYFLGHRNDGSRFIVGARMTR